ncbi:MAG: D-alanyl-D-alanine carboxypeptidase/D-alanyl-D-alanine-endopeptidase [Ancrocorticia sp.]|uniref:D-alanyl-D-alanine carboxypeptidase/D-alanyl-D-alanine-endopeptidase n=1 Tax=Ancrocorticia sp. TaxID=2593684 RepID=UPI003F93768A
MKRKTQVVATALLALGGIYVLTDAFDLTPGLITTRPVGDTAQEYPSIEPVQPANISLPSLDEEAPVPSTESVSGAITEFAEDSRLEGEPSVQVIDTLTGEALGGLNEAEPRVPASNEKLLTSVAALETLGPDATMDTTAMLADGTLYLVGGGDVLLSAGAGDDSAVTGHAGLGDLADQAAEALAEQGTSTVDLAVDTSLFSGPRYHPDVEGADTAYVMAMSPIAIDRGRSDSGYSSDPEGDATQAFASALEGHGISVNIVDPATAPEGSAEVGRIHSASVRVWVDQMLTDSDNSLAEVLGHLVGIKHGEAGDFEGGAKATAEILTSLDYPMEGVTISDNSGLSISNRLTTDLQVGILDNAYSCDGCNLEAIASGLPVAGLNGTLGDRLAEDDLGGVIRGKTGTLIQAVSLSGYLYTDSGRLLTFSVLVDDIEEGHAPGTRQVIDDFLSSLTDL